ncbi:sensor domain-containing diguanylate cyclase [Bacillus timonensis]|uniref:sensor domain-containing diguanylate cyclase n=1 Tax=Bacillus timonensis TaxID=1033734 RepID=UPI000288F7D7|nr:diguanylate cyclase [Bacillus timonensis]
MKFPNEDVRYEQLFRVTSKFHSTMNIDAVLEEVINTLQDVYPSFTYTLFLAHDNKRHNVIPIKDIQEYEHGENSLVMQAFVTGKLQLEDSVSDKKSIIYAPLKGRQGVYGVLQINAHYSLVFPQSEIQFIELLANTAGHAFENAQLYQQSKQLIADLQLINETSHKLNSNLRLVDTMTFMSSQIKKSFGANEVGFFLQSNEQIEVLPGSTTFFEEGNGEQYVLYSLKRILAEKEPLFIGDLQVDPSFRKSSFRSMMSVPMVQQNEILGVAIVLHESPYFFSFDKFKLLQSLIHHSSLAFTNSILREELEKLVITDYLTKLYSRNHLEDCIQESLETDAFGTFILIDIDDFKGINDTYGHQVGDEAIVQIANLIKENIRDHDIGARWGGEELAIYLPRVDLASGIAVAQRLGKRVEAYSNPKITISCGVATWFKEYKETFQSLFHRADNALYIAKQSGKNQVIASESKVIEGHS